MAEIVPILEAMFHLMAKGGIVLPPKIFFHRDGPPPKTWQPASKS
jgi:hypothetical protein